MTNPPSLSFDRLELMQTFIRIVESKNLSHAAQTLRTTQPTISRRLKSLEETLGLRLLLRTTHQMQLTDEGRRFYHHAKDLIERWELVESEMQGAKSAPTGILRVQVPQALGIGKFNDLLARYLELYPRASIDWSLSDKTPDFLTENLDCAIKVGNVDDPNLVALKIFELPRLIAGAPELVKKLSRAKSPVELRDLPWIAFRTHYTDRIALTHTKTNDALTLELAPRFRTDSLLSMREVGLRGLGIGIFSRWVIEEDIKTGRLVHLCPNWQASPLPVYLVYPQSRLKPAKLEKFIELIKKKA